MRVDEWGRIGVPFRTASRGLIEFEVTIGEFKCDAVIDTGASEAFISLQAYEALRLHDPHVRELGLMESSVKRVMCANSTSQPVLGVFQVVMRVGPLQLRARLHVVREQPVPILIGGATLATNEAAIDYLQQLFFAEPGRGWFVSALNVRAAATSAAQAESSKTRRAQREAAESDRVPTVTTSSKTRSVRAESEERVS